MQKKLLGNLKNYKIIEHERNHYITFIFAF